MLDELREWQHRPLEAVYPMLYIDALVIKVRTSGVVTNRPAYVAIGVDVDGRKHIFGVWLGVPDGWLTLNQAAAALGMARQTVLHKFQRGDLNAVHGNRWPPQRPPYPGRTPRTWTV